MKKMNLLLLFLCTSLACVVSGQQPVSPSQTLPAADFPERHLKGTDNFNIAIDVYGDLRGNFGPCG